MRILKINSVFLIIEGLVMFGLCIYWSAVYPESARMHLIRWTWSRDAVIGVVIRIGLVSLVLGCLGYLLAALVDFARSLAK